MSLVRPMLRRVRSAVLANSNLPQQCAIGLRGPQSEVRVELHGLRSHPLGCDVTARHMIACASPFTIGIGLDAASSLEVSEAAHPTLKFFEQGGDQRLLAEIALILSTSVPAGEQELFLFEIRSVRNYCLPKARLWAHYLFLALLRARGGKKPGEIPMVARGVHAGIACFVCPRPVVLVSVADPDQSGAGNLFPMNLMGPAGEGYFAFSLNSTRQASPLVQRARRVALSDLPFELSDRARELRGNHKRESIQWSEVPFPTRNSDAFGIPVPEFALRVREMEVESVRRLGSHTVFVARIVHEERYRDGLQFHMIHGIYQAWRLRQRPDLCALPTDLRPAC
jgi:flavin reductase (DIM6/NTAB) family NADH-FMN oxidoreductase RutF